MNRSSPSEVRPNNVYQRLDMVSHGDEYRGRSKYLVQIWWIIQDTFFRWSPQVLYGWRNFLLRLFGAQLGVGVRIRQTARITFPWKITIGNYSRIGDDVVLYSLDNITIGNHVVISQNSYLSTGTHDYQKATFDLLTAPILVKDHVWLAADVFVAPGVHIGKGCVVGARSTVLHDLPEGMVCFGTPAKPVKERNAS